MPDRVRARLRHAVLCDDIRVEHNRKFLLVGCYSDQVSVDELPAIFQGALSISVDFDRTAPGETMLRVQQPGREEQFGALTFDDAPDGVDQAWVEVDIVAWIETGEERIVVSLEGAGSAEVSYVWRFTTPPDVARADDETVAKLRQQFEAST